MASRVSQIIADKVRAVGTTEAFGESVGLSHSTIWRLMNDKTVADGETLRKLCSSLTKEEGAALLIAYIHDVLPQDLRMLVSITPVVSGTKEQPTDSMDVLWDRLHPRVQGAFRRLAHLSVEDDEVGDALFTWAKTMTTQDEWSNFWNAAQVADLASKGATAKRKAKH